MKNEKAASGEVQPSESIRSWYDRTTVKIRKAIIVASVLGLIFAICFYIFAPHSVNLKLQIFNGAVTIPVAAGIWIAAFVWLFLLPSREAGFRSQESMEATVKMLDKAITEKIVPAIEIWQRVGLSMEQHLPEVLRDIRTSIETVKEVSSKNDKLAQDVGPAIEALKRIQQKIEKEISTGFFEDARAAMEGIKGMTIPKETTTPDLNRALSAIGNKRKG